MWSGYFARGKDLGFLLPTLTAIENQLSALLEDNTLVKPLINVLKAGISKRFGEIKNNTDAQLAAVVHPQFKLYWLDDETQKAQLVSTLKSRIDNMIQEENKEIGNEISPSQQLEDFSTNFFGAFSTKRQKIDCVVGVEEASRYLADVSSELSSLNQYPHIKQLYTTLNTGLPASAAVERLFSLGGRTFSPASL